MEEFCPQVTHLNILGFLLVHYHTLLGLGKAEYQKGETYQGKNQHGNKPSITVGRKRVALLSSCCLITGPCKNCTRNNTTQSHTCLIEDTGQGIDDAGNTLAAGIFCKRDNLWNQSPHISCSYDYAC